MNVNSKAKAPLTIHNWVLAAKAELRTALVPTPELDAELILAFALDVDRTWLHAHGEDAPPLSVIKKADILLAKRIHRVPLAYLTGTKEFYGREFTVTPDVLIPRPESETLIELAKKHHLSGRILDVGCGSGALGLTLALELPVSLTLSDISYKALDIARKNAKALSVSPVRYVHSDLLDHWLSHQRPKPFDAIVANLPYVDKSWERSPETNHEPALALFADARGLALINRLITQTSSLLKKDGYLLLEADPEQHSSIIAEAKKSGLAHETTQDYIVAFKRI